MKTMFVPSLAAGSFDWVTEETHSTSSVVVVAAAADLGQEGTTRPPSFRHYEDYFDSLLQEFQTVVVRSLCEMIHRPHRRRFHRRRQMICRCFSSLKTDA